MDDEKIVWNNCYNPNFLTDAGKTAKILTSPRADEFLKSSKNSNCSKDTLVNLSLLGDEENISFTSILRDPWWEKASSFSKKQLDVNCTFCSLKNDQLLATLHPTETHFKMLSTIISTVMLMASKVSEIPKEYITCTERYLKCIKNEKGDNPVNIKGVLNHITYLRIINQRLRGFSKYKRKNKSIFTKRLDIPNNFKTKEWVWKKTCVFQENKKKFNIKPTIKRNTNVEVISVKRSSCSNFTLV